MTIIEKIDDWKKFPNALGSESQVAVLLGEISASLDEPLPNTVVTALKTLSIRGAMRDIASAIQRNEERHFRADVVDSAAMRQLSICRCINLTTFSICWRKFS